MCIRDSFGSDVLVIVQGRLAAEGDFHAIRDLMDDRPHRIGVRTDKPRAVATGLMHHRAATGVEVVDEHNVLVETTDVARFRHTVAAIARQQDAALYEVTPLDDDLESVFRYLVVQS